MKKICEHYSQQKTLINVYTGLHLYMHWLGLENHQQCLCENSMHVQVSAFSRAPLSHWVISLTLYACIHVYMCVHIHVCVYMCMQVCIYIYIYCVLFNIILPHKVALLIVMYFCTLGMLPCQVTSVKVSPVVPDPKSEVLLDGKKPGDATPLCVGETRVEIQVTSPDGSNKQVPFFSVL